MDHEIRNLAFYPLNYGSAIYRYYFVKKVSREAGLDIKLRVELQEQTMNDLFYITRFLKMCKGLENKLSGP